MYGIIISISIFLCILLVEKISSAKGLNKNTVWGLAFWVILFGVIGARIYHVIDYWEYYKLSPLYIFYIWHGGLGIIGGIISGTIALVVYLHLHHEKVLIWTDSISSILPLGQFMGRWANIWNKELLPVAWYEMGLDLLLFFILQLMSRKIKTHPGYLTFGYFVGYFLIRVITHHFRVRVQ